MGTSSRFIQLFYDRVADCLFLALVVLLSLLPYTGDLGFYSDDWSLLAWCSLAPDQSPFGLFWYIYSPHHRMRPTAIAYQAGLYWLFGPEPLGYHLVNAAVFIAMALLLYLALAELGMPRLLALAVPLTYALLPHYSTARFWIAVNHANLSMALYFFGLYADLRTLRPGGISPWLWKLSGIVALTASALAYEVALPLFLLNPLVVLYRSWAAGASGSTRARRLKLVMWSLSSLAVFVAAVVFKALTTTRLGHRGSLAGEFYAILRRALDLSGREYEYGLNLRTAVEVNYGQYGLALPRVVWQSLQGRPDDTTLIASGAIGLLVFLYLSRVARRPGERWPSPLAWSGLVGAGLVLFGLGYAVFLTNRNIQIVAAGLGNRTATAAALGVAITFVGAIGLGSTLLRSGLLRGGVFCGAAAILAMSGALTINYIASLWAAAYRQETEVLAGIRARFPTLPANSGLVLDGVCSYVGPAVVFESDGLSGALVWMYRDPSIQGLVVTPRLRLEEEGISTSLYGVRYFHTYGDDLFLYHFGRGEARRFVSAEAARAYFEAFNSDLSSGCPAGREGEGVPLF